MTDHSINAGKRSEIARKVRALLGKTVENGATEHEAMAAAEVADRLMAEYDLTYSDVEQEVRGERYGNRGKKFCGGSWRRRSRHEVQYVLWAIKAYWNCECWFSGDQLIFFGTADDTEFAHQMTDLLRIVMNMEWERFFKNPDRKRNNYEHGRLQRNSFMRGMCNRMGKRLSELKAARDKVAETIKATDGRSLVVVRKDVTKEKWEQFKAEKELKLRSTQNKIRRWSMNAYHAGQAAGDRVDLGTAKVNRPNERITAS